jgi:hypothetical protein
MYVIKEKKVTKATLVLEKSMDKVTQYVFTNINC